MNSEQNWLPLAEYSMKHKISVSTLRRRIKAEDIHFRFDDGKYFILDSAENLPVEEKNNQTVEHRPSLKSETAQSLVGISNPLASRIASQNQNQLNQAKETESVLTAANRLLSDLKQAYSQVLQEKEEQILTLKEEITDLKTLIKVLESENTRLRRVEFESYSSNDDVYVIDDRT